MRDITLRALDILAGADEVLAEDTRTARRLLDAHNLKASVTPYHDHNGAQRRPDILNKLQGGAAIALISDAGTPLVSDPGWKLAREAIEAGCQVVPIPGASAALAGLVVSGLPSDRFCFCGFLPAKSGARKSEIEALANVPATLIFYEAGPRLTATLQALAQTLGGHRQAAIARELTKLFEETRRGTLQTLSDHYAEAGPPKGEIVILVGPPDKMTVTGETLDQALYAALAEQSVKQAAADVSQALQLSRREVYQRALQIKSEI